nr:MAG TPA: hypothetical protein [Caudoviricetes sp.]
MPADNFPSLSELNNFHTPSFEGVFLSNTTIKNC